MRGSAKDPTQPVGRTIRFGFRPTACSAARLGGCPAVARTDSPVSSHSLIPLRCGWDAQQPHVSNEPRATVLDLGREPGVPILDRKAVELPWDDRDRPYTLADRRTADGNRRARSYPTSPHRRLPPSSAAWLRCSSSAYRPVVSPRIGDRRRALPVDGCRRNPALNGSGIASSVRGLRRVSATREDPFDRCLPIRCAAGGAARCSWAGQRRGRSRRRSSVHRGTDTARSPSPGH
jgi:hypothetical protein